MNDSPLRGSIAALGRVTQALSTTDDDPLAIARLARDASDVAGRVLADAVDLARESGVTWQALGDMLGTSRQAAFQRFGHPIDPRTGAPMNTTTLPDAGPRATEVFERMASTEWELVCADFDDTMRAALTPDALAAAWAQMIGLVGAFEGQAQPFIRGVDGITIVDVPLTFEAGEMVGRVSFSAVGQIAGLYLLTPSAAAGL